MAKRRFRWNSLVSSGVRKPLHRDAPTLQKFLAQGARQSSGKAFMLPIAMTTNAPRCN